MGFFKKLFKGDWSNPFDNIKSGAGNFVSSAVENSKDGWDKFWRPALGVGAALYGGNALGGAAGLLGGGNGGGGPTSAGSVVQNITSGISGSVGDWFDKLGDFVSNPAMSGYIDWKSSKDAAEFNADEADKNRSWLERMRRTQYEAAMGDLERSGLNPMLAYMQGGAGVPSSGAPSMSASRPGSTAVAAKAMQNTGALQREQQLSTQSQSVLNNAKAAEALQNAAVGVQEEINKKVHRGLTRAQTAETEAKLGQIDAQIRMLTSTTSLQQEQTHYWSAKASTEGHETRIRELEKKRAELLGLGYSAASPIVQEVDRALNALLSGKGPTVKRVGNDKGGRTPVRPGKHRTPQSYIGMPR